MIRIRLNRDIHHILHRLPHSLHLRIRQHTRRRSRMHPREMEDLVRDPVSYTSAERLVHDEALDG